MSTTGNWTNRQHALEFHKIMQTAFPCPDWRAACSSWLITRALPCDEPHNTGGFRRVQYCGWAFGVLRVRKCWPRFWSWHRLRYFSVDHKRQVRFPLQRLFARQLNVLLTSDKLLLFELPLGSDVYSGQFRNRLVTLLVIAGWLPLRSLKRNRRNWLGWNIRIVFRLCPHLKTIYCGTIKVSGKMLWTTSFKCAHLNKRWKRISDRNGANAEATCEVQEVPPFATTSSRAG